MRGIAAPIECLLIQINRPIDAPDIVRRRITPPGIDGLRLLSLPNVNMTNAAPLHRAKLKTSKAAAVAGILFAVLVIAAYFLLKTSIPADRTQPSAWLQTNTHTIALGLNLIPYAGVAFLWFIGVIRERTGPLEDRFFATVFLGSSLLFLGMLFVAAAVMGALITVLAAAPHEALNSSAFPLAREIAYNLVNVYMVKMAAAVTISLSTVIILTAIAAFWLAVLGYALALFLLFGSGYVDWAFVTFPVWILMISLHVFLEDWRSATDAFENADPLEIDDPLEVDDPLEIDQEHHNAGSSRDRR
jgi:hypothetical protein